MQVCVNREQQAKAVPSKNAMDVEKWYTSAVVIGYAPHVEAEMKVLFI